MGPVDAGEVSGPGRPTGTVSFLFTDVEGSTRLWQEQPAAMSTALARHDQILRAAIGTQRGLVFSTAGDSFAAAFWTPDEAVDAALLAQRHLTEEPWPASVIVRVRMAVHTGTAEERDGDYFGPTLNQAARLMASAHGGQVLVSDVTRSLVRRADLVDLGEHQLKDVPGPRRVWQVGAADFPPIRASRRAEGNLPPRNRAFIGRADDRKRLAAELRAGELITLTGMGGVGKTRLALETAHGAADDQPDGAWWCDLTPIEGPDAVPVAVAAMLAVNLQGDLTPTAAIVDALRSRQAFVVFDNCEHVLEAAAGLVEAVVAGCPRVTALATSREPLGIDAERVWPVRPLDPDGEGVELFLERATAADVTFVPGDDRRVLVELCRQVDGIPLAIELAAWARSMTPDEVLARLDDRFRLLRAGGRRGVERHRTLLATLDWSYGLLDEREQRLADRLGVFSGTFDVDAVEAVCADDGLDALDVVDLVSGLVDKSMVVAERGQVGTRYRLLETVRQYCEAHARDRGELEALRDRHLAHFLVLAERAFAGWLDDYHSGRSLLDRDWDNLRAATHHALARRDRAIAERLFAALSWPASYALTYEVGDWARQAVELGCAGPATYGTAATMAAIIGRFDDGERFARAGIAAAADPLAPDTWMCWTGLMQGLSRAGWNADADEAVAAAHRAATEAIGAWGDAFFSAVGSFRLARTDPATASELAHRADAIAGAKGNAILTVDVLHLVAIYHSLIGDHAGGVDRARRALELAEQWQLPRSSDGARNSYAQLALIYGVSDPLPAVRDAIRCAVRERLWYDLWPTIRTLARWLADRAHTELATVIVGHLDAHGLAASNARVFDELRGAPAAQPLLQLGAGLDRDGLTSHILEHLPTDATDGVPRPE